MLTITPLTDFKDQCIMFDSVLIIMLVTEILLKVVLNTITPIVLVKFYFIYINLFSLTVGNHRIGIYSVTYRSLL